MGPHGFRVVSRGARVNPALTIMANALRVGDHLLERLG
jgi:choline dehydrogenase-like flavoprotein